MARKSVDTLAKEVLANKWGVGKDRVRRLTAKGYDYEKVQKRVNELYTADSTADKIIHKKPPPAFLLLYEKYIYIMNKFIIKKVIISNKIAIT